LTPKVLLWDFGDTLADERWMLRAPSRFPGWPAAWADVMADHADRWNAGSASGAEIFDALAQRTGMTLREVEAHARECCQRIQFHPNAWRVASEHRLPQALVTVNPDLFEQYVLHVHGLPAVFDAVVMSFAEGTNDKTALCDIALRRLDHDGDRASALLIDNRLDLVEAWRSAGGTGYRFTNDEEFGRDLEGTLRWLGEPTSGHGWQSFRHGRIH
jgi:hypothetical protein